MIPKAILKKHNLKAVDFSEIKDGQTFNVSADFPRWLSDCKRVLNGDLVNFASGNSMDSQEYASTKKGRTVYVPVWRVTK